MLTRVIAAAAAVAGANALQACVWLGNDECPDGASFVCKEMPDGECVEVLGIPGTTVYGQFEDQGNGITSVGVHLNDPNCVEDSESDITDPNLASGGYDYANPECQAAATIAGQTAYIKTTGDFDSQGTGGDANGDDDDDNNGDVVDDSGDNGSAQTGQPPALGDIQSVLSLLSSSGLSPEFVKIFRSVITSDSGRVRAFLAELSDVNIPGILAAFKALPDLSNPAPAEPGSGGLPSIPSWVPKFASQVKSSIRQRYTRDLLDSLADSTATNLVTNCGGFFFLYGAKSVIGKAVAGSDFSSQVDSILGTNPEENRCDGDKRPVALLPCTVGFLNTGVATCSADVCCGAKGAVARVPIVAQILGEIITNVLKGLISPVIESALPYIKGGIASVANAVNGDLNILTNCGVVFHYASTLKIKGLVCKKGHTLDKLQPCATKEGLVKDAPWRKCSKEECCGGGKEQPGIGRTITAFIAYEEAKLLEKIVQQLKIVVAASAKTNPLSGKYLVTCRQWKNWLGGKCNNGQENVDHDMFCSTYSCMGFGVHKCSGTICCHNASEGWIGAVLAIAATSGKLFEFAQISLASNPFKPQYMLSCGKYNELYGIKCPSGDKLDSTMPCTIDSWEHKTSFYKCTRHNCCNQFSKNYKPAAVFESALEVSDSVADVLFAIGKTKPGELFTSGKYTNVQFVVNCETWAAIPGWGYRAEKGCIPNTNLPADVSCPNEATESPRFQPLAPCQALQDGPGVTYLGGTLRSCRAICYEPGASKKTNGGVVLATQSVAYSVQLIYLLTHMIAEPVKGQAIATFLSGFKDVITGGRPPALNLVAILAALGPFLPPNFDDFIAGRLPDDFNDVFISLMGRIPILPLDGLLMNCGVWSNTLDMNYFGRGTCETGRPVDHDLPCWVSSLKTVAQAGKGGLRGLKTMYKVNIQPNVGDCTPEYCCACRTKAGYSNSAVRAIGSAGGAITNLLIKTVITPLIFKVGRSVEILGRRFGFGRDQIYMPQFGYGGQTPGGPPFIPSLGEIVIGNQFCVKHSKYPDGSLPSTLNYNRQGKVIVTFVNGTAGSPCNYWGGETE